MSDVYRTEEFKINSHKFRVEFSHDCCMGAPWEEHEGHGPVRTVSAYYGNPEKRAGEIVIHSNRGEHWLYDVRAATETARKEWGLSDDEKARMSEKLGRAPTLGEIAARAVQLDIKELCGWLRDDWHWCIVSVSMLNEKGNPIEETRETCGGFSSEDDYTMEWANSEAMHMEYMANKETEEKAYWAERDVCTTF